MTTDSLEKPEGEITKVDLEKVIEIGLKEAKLKNLTELKLRDTKITDTGLKEVVGNRAHHA